MQQREPAVQHITGRTRYIAPSSTRSAYVLPPLLARLCDGRLLGAGMPGNMYPMGAGNPMFYQPGPPGAIGGRGGGYGYPQVHSRGQGMPCWSYCWPGT